jgi:UDP-N-acetylmuramoylalanine--D-glutamate ligase
MDKQFCKGKTVLVMGLGRFGGGIDSAVFAHQAGANVIVTDLADEKRLKNPLGQLSQYKDMEYHLAGHRKQDFQADSTVDIIIVNPAVPPDNEFLKIARQAGKKITSQIEILFQLCPAQIIGITGANGKSTTTALTAHLLQSGPEEQGLDYQSVWLGGNIGNKPLLTSLEKMGQRDVVVLELSSFQLEQLAQIEKAPHISVVTNLSPNHLDRHGTFENYCSIKENAFRFQTLDEKHPAVSIFNAEDIITRQWLEKYSRQKGRLCQSFEVSDVPKQLVQEFTLVGRANLSNLAAALSVAKHFRLEQNTLRKALASFKPLPHRLELVAKVDGVAWYNDSIATTPTSAMVALDAFSHPKIIIAGGYDKNLPFDELGKKIAKKAKAAILIGATARKIEDAVARAGKTDVRVEIVSSLSDAVDCAASFALPGDIVILSPACASYDMFDNFQQRGEVFGKLVKALES